MNGVNVSIDSCSCLKKIQRVGPSKKGNKVRYGDISLGGVGYMRIA